jgi:hypothetical protein
VLGPQQRENGQLEIVRVALEEFADPLELAVCEPERPVQGLFGNLRQEAIVPADLDGSWRRSSPVGAEGDRSSGRASAALPPALPAPGAAGSLPR